MSLACMRHAPPGLQRRSDPSTSPFLHSLSSRCRGAPCSGLPLLAVLANTTCEVDRSTLALFYSRNLLDWSEAGLVDYTLAFHRHFSYPNALIDGRDLLVVSRASLGGDAIHPCAAPPTFAFPTLLLLLLLLLSVGRVDEAPALRGAKDAAHATGGWSHGKRRSRAMFAPLSSLNVGRFRKPSTRKRRCHQNHHEAVVPPTSCTARLRVAVPATQY
jgi:hypothetical protein